MKKFGFSNMSNFLPVFLLLCFSGNPLFTAQEYSKTLLIAYSLIFILFTSMKTFFLLKKKAFKHLVFVLIFIVFVSIGQFLSLGLVSYPGVLSTILKILLALYTLNYYDYKKIDFLDTYIKIVAFLALISIPFFILNFFVHIGVQLSNPILKSMLLYTSSNLPINEIRNFGMFWEPGAFAGYLLLGLLFIVIKNKKFSIGLYFKEVFFISLAILTTISTTGYIILGLIVIFYLFQNLQYSKIIVLPIVAFILIWAYNSLNFMVGKIESQFLTASVMTKYDVANTRFGAFRMDVPYIMAEPVFGNGLHVNTRYRFHPWVKEDIGHGNGMSNFIACWGIPFFLFWLYCVFIFCRTNENSSLISTLVLILIVLLLQGEQFLNYPLFLSFFILPFYKYSVTKTTK